MTPMERTVFVVDDDPSVLRGLERLLRSAGYAVEAHASARAFLERAPADRPGCVVVDLRMPEIGGLDLQEELARRGFPLPLIFLTGHGDVPSSVRAMKGGAIDFLSKPCDDTDLLAAVERALARDAEARAARVEKEAVRARFAALTPREREVALLVAQGLLNKQIAAELGAAEKTIKVHRGRVMEKLGAESLADLVRLVDRIRDT
ncbi:response regulator transcription factor [Polyangium jinanense]|uniref:Response regulator transcription factor n=2 Tax=Polyangium jinanense TaxID=2829994 RepID=A0A9X4AZD3_9BACT|nr:response regulator [Polyangium jinanense]MDC3959798.1 response regulator transcription factor [Polyangium jinanense]MDC3988057.1 response regulator transcription factor [Polyangium jinanense]